VVWTKEDLWRVQQTIGEQMHLDRLADAEEHLKNDLKADEIDLLVIMMSLEDEFDISIPEEEAANWKTVGDVIAYIQKAIEKQGGSAS
jgi:acyl carrier protein